MLNIHSGFDGSGTLYQACKNIGLPVNRYWANEIDPYAIKIAKKNHWDIKHLGDITDQYIPSCGDGIDLMVAGSPCQGFSFAGKQLAFNDNRSRLFFEWIRLFEKVKPKWFLFENVKMKQEHQDVISRYLGVQPIEINSSLVSAQNRKRLYWTNIPYHGLPEDKGIVLQDILENGFSDRDKSHCIDANYFKGGNLKSYFEKHRRQLVFSNEGLHREPKVLVKGGRIVNRRLNKDGVRKDYDKSIPLQLRLELRDDDKTNCLTTVYKDSVVVTPNVVIAQRPRGKNSGGIKACDGKTPTLSSNAWEQNNFLVDSETLRWRKLTPLECERLQTLPDNYTEGVSNTQRYKMLGNGFTCAVIEHLLKGLL
jgi:DNA-cytosine methyltransferase